jgi:acetyl-CoA synthetase
MLRYASDLDQLYREFSWDIPAQYNIGVDLSDKHGPKNGSRTALIFVDEHEQVTSYSFRDISQSSNRLANVLVAGGLRRGDRVAILLPQAPETAIAHVAVLKAGMISVPLFALFGEDALEFRLRDSGTRAIVTDGTGAAKLQAIRDRLPALEHLYVSGPDQADSRNRRLADVLDRASDMFSAVPTRADDPALIIYTSGTTGNPKGALHAHRVLPGHLPCVELSHDFFPRPDDLIWTPADWAWIGGLLDVMMPALHHGVPVLAHRARKFDPEHAMRLMAAHSVRNVFIPPTALKLMRQAGVRNPGVSLRTATSGGETLGAELLDWGRETFGVTLNEFYGQTECNLVACNNARLFPVRSGSLGRAAPGHRVCIVDEDGQVLPAGRVGTVGVQRPDPVMFLGYWNDPEATARKFAGDFLLTGDLARQDEEGYFWFVGRSDDLITSAGYRIGPGEIEDCLVKHPAVALSAVIGVPDPIRTEAVKAWIVLRAGFEASDELAADIQQFVRTRLAAHEYPRHIAFTDVLPMTTTGKIIRRELRSRG